MKAQANQWYGEESVNKVLGEWGEWSLFDGGRDVSATHTRRVYTRQFNYPLR